MIEYGIRWSYQDATLSHVGGGYTLEGARRMLAGAGDPKRFHPFAARVVERDVSEWREAESPAVQGDSTPNTTAPTGKIRGAPRRGLDDPAATTCPSSDITGKEPSSS